MREPYITDDELDETPRMPDMPKWAKYQVWQFGECSYFKSLAKAEDKVNEFWAQQFSQILRIVNK